jgi:hypothetical protein
LFLAYAFLRNSSGNLAIFAASRRDGVVARNRQALEQLLDSGAGPTIRLDG